jgi:hypothetical protein
MSLTVWEDMIKEIEGLEIGEKVHLKKCFITSFQGELSVNVGRDSEVIRIIA